MSAILTSAFGNCLSLPASKLKFFFVQTLIWSPPNWRLELKKINYHRFDEMLSSKRQKSAFIEMLAFETKQLLTHIIAKG